VAEKDKPSIPISQQANRPTERPVLFGADDQAVGRSVLEQATGSSPRPLSAIEEAARHTEAKRVAAPPSIRETIVQAVEDQKARMQPPSTPENPSGHHGASSDATWTGRYLDYLGLGFILVPPEPVVAALMRGEPIHWEIALPLLFSCWAVGGALLYGGLTWPKWKPKNEAIAATISSATHNIWVWMAVLVAIAFGPTILYSKLSSRVPVESPAFNTVKASSALCSDGPCAPVHLKPAPQYLKEIGFAAGPEPLTLQATSAVTADRLRVFVDYSEYRDGWMPRARAFVGELKEPVKGNIERLQLI
jgi:hypothetical protein